VRKTCTLALVVLALVPPAVLAAQTPGHVRLGLHGGFNLSNGEVEQGRLGIQGAVPIAWLLTVNPAVSYIYDFPDDPTGTFEGSAWETYLTLRVQPFGLDSWLGLGYGLTYAHLSVHTKDGTFSDSAGDATDVGVIALTLPKGRVRPFADFYLIGLLERRASVGAHLLFGANLLVP
jgi:hypothetical protein